MKTAIAWHYRTAISLARKRGYAYVLFTDASKLFAPFGSGMGPHDQPSSLMGPEDPSRRDYQVVDVVIFARTTETKQKYRILSL